MARFDLEATRELERLFAVPRESRDEAWVEAFYAAIPDASMTVGEHQVVKGPDGFPYFRLLLPEPETAFDAFCVTHVLDLCLEKGYGVVVMTGEPRPQWAFPYGNLWSYREHGAFALPPPEGDGLTGSALVASPSEAVLPAYARAVLRRELESQGASRPGVLLADTGAQRALAFAPMPDPQRVLWYLPPHMGLTNVIDGWPEPMPL